MVSDGNGYIHRFDIDVLILVLMEYGLGRSEHEPINQKHYDVLILVLMEYGLGPYIGKAVRVKSRKS